jgi:hypothetical protein
MAGADFERACEMVRLSELVEHPLEIISRVPLVVIGDTFSDTDNEDFVPTWSIDDMPFEVTPFLLLSTSSVSTV